MPRRLQSLPWGLPNPAEDPSAEALESFSFLLGDLTGEVFLLGDLIGDDFFVLPP